MTEVPDSILSRYMVVVEGYFSNQDEKWLAEASTIGRDALQQNIPPEEIAEIQEQALAMLARNKPDLTLREASHLITAPFTEMLMAYGLAYREQVKIRESLLAALESANRSKTEFLANMSHELRTPLNAIIGFSEMMTEEMFGPVQNEKYLEYAGDITRSGSFLLEIINDILDVSKIEAGKLTLTEEDVDLAQVLNSGIRLIRDRAHEKKLVLIEEIASPLPLLLGDERRIKQALVNLLANAVKFTPERGRVTIRCALDTEGCVWISVEDTGIGIDPKNIKKIMEPFGQADNSHTRKYGGTGLGLPLAKRLIELHSGALEISSVLGEGTALKIVFPSHRTILAEG
ncbi:sensor histidine kinase [Magnetovibrio blakemorei]|uniref:histidine kinase n=1 Tax=Magnetovibrio blakemorei TaxID=28181 RepID=A0A1E5Q3F5_9PROT|nr:ATP-binding protein [Magnetovibrio blakemorei]OEJ63804.1 hypothetical protein BEN30_17355 [Magnetovibrio blakemorei]